MLAVGDKAIVRYGRYRRPCTVIQIASEGELVRVKVKMDSDGSIYVFTSSPFGGYSRLAPSGMFNWMLDTVVEDGTMTKPSPNREALRKALRW